MPGAWLGRGAVWEQCGSSATSTGWAQPPLLWGSAGRLPARKGEHWLCTSTWKSSGVLGVHWPQGELEGWEQHSSRAGAEQCWGWTLLTRAGCPHTHKYSRCRQDWLGFDGGFARELLQGSLSFSVCVKHFPESKFCYRKTIYQMPPSADTLGRICQPH